MKFVNFLNFSSVLYLNLYLITHKIFKMTYKAKITIVVEFNSNQSNNDAINEIASESDYNIGDTENVTIVDTEFRDIELI